MSGDKLIHKMHGTRPILGDVTNLPEKRAFSLISGNLGIEFGVSNGKSRDDNDDSHLPKQICTSLESSVKEKCVESLSNKENKGLSQLNGKEAVALSHAISFKVLNEANETLNLLEGGGDFVSSHTATNSTRGDDALNNFLPSFSTVGSSRLNKEASDIEISQVDDVGLINDVTQNIPLSEGAVSQSCGDDFEDSSVEKLVPSICNYSGSLKLPKLHSVLERCTEKQVESCANINLSTDLLKSCSCSFCLKVAYIWSDLHVQDVKGRISALKKSQKAANILVQKSPNAEEINIGAQENSRKSSNLEPDLSSQWKSLFSHTENILIQESRQLQGNYLALKSLRESCKADLEKVSKMPFDRR